MIYKCVKSKENIDINEFIVPIQSIRGHIKKLCKKKKDVTEFSFLDKALDQWNK